MKTNLLFVAITASVFTLCSCQKTELVPFENLKQPVKESKGIRSGFTGDCVPTQAIILTEENTSAGNITVVNLDNENIYVTYTCDSDWALAQTALYAGDCELIPIGNDGTPDISGYPFITTHNFETSYTYIIPVSNIPGGSCGCISAFATVVNTAGTNQVLSSWGVIKNIVTDGSEKDSYSFKYCSCY